MEAVNIDDNGTEDALEGKIVHLYRMLSISDPEMNALSDDNIDTKAALQGPEAAQFYAALVVEWANLTTATLEPISQADLEGKDYEKITITFKSKRKLKPTGELDKYKVRGAGRGDVYIRQRLKKGKPLPKTFSPTVKPITFAWILQLAIMKKMKRSTMDIKQAYLNVPIPEDEDWIIAKLEPWIAEALSLDPNALYRVRRYIYGLPQSGRAFFEMYRAKLLKEGYTQSKMDSCLFYRLQDGEETYILLYVDDTFIFSNEQKYIDALCDKLQKYFEVTLDESADAFLGVSFEYDAGGNCKLSQKKLLTKLFREYPQDLTKRRRKPIHPYGPAPTHGKVMDGEDKEAVEITTYLRLLGILMYLTKSRPEIATGVSFGATNSHNPLQYHYKELLYIVDYLREYQDEGLTIRVPRSKKIQLHTEVDASYLLHSDSKGHSGYAIGVTGGGFFYIRSSKQ
jgi:hypothetical protein